MWTLKKTISSGPKFPFGGYLAAASSSASTDFQMCLEHPDTSSPELMALGGQQGISLHLLLKIKSYALKMRIIFYCKNTDSRWGQGLPVHDGMAAEAPSPLSLSSVQLPVMVCAGPQAAEV